MPYCKERLECKHFDPAGCDAEVGTGCFEEIDKHQTDEVSPSNSSALLCDLKSQVATNAIKKITDILAARLAEHYDSSPTYLIPEALEEYKNDLEILVNLGA